MLNNVWQIPNPAPFFSEIPDPENNLPDPVIGCACGVLEQQTISTIPRIFQLGDSADIVSLISGGQR